MSVPGEKRWEMAGTFFGLIACLAITLQIIRLLRTGNAVSLSLSNLLLFVGNYGFWAGYGFRFKRFAVWSTNCLACLLQMILLVLYFVLI
jgi:uncharacterized protein with PQ loop repeat